MHAEATPEPPATVIVRRTWSWSRLGTVHVATTRTNVNDSRRFDAVRRSFMASAVGPDLPTCGATGRRARLRPLRGGRIPPVDLIGCQAC